MPSTPLPVDFGDDACDDPNERLIFTFGKGNGGNLGGFAGADADCQAAAANAGYSGAENDGADAVGLDGYLTPSPCRVKTRPRRALPPGRRGAHAAT